MRFIEQPQRRAANCHHGKGRASLLPRRHARNGRTEKPIVQTHPLRRFFDFIALCSDDIAPEAQIFARTEIEIQTVRVTEESNARSNGIAFAGNIETHDAGRAAGDGKKTRAQTQQRGFAGAVRALHEQNLATLNGEVRLGESRE